jgi:hypothetical protein
MTEFEIKDSYIEMKNELERFGIPYGVTYNGLDTVCYFKLKDLINVVGCDDVNELIVNDDINEYYELYIGKGYSAIWRYVPNFIFNRIKKFVGVVVMVIIYRFDVSNCDD